MSYVNCVHGLPMYSGCKVCGTGLIPPNDNGEKFISCGGGAACQACKEKDAEIYRLNHTNHYSYQLCQEQQAKIEKLKAELKEAKRKKK